MKNDDNHLVSLWSKHYNLDTDCWSELCLKSILNEPNPGADLCNEVMSITLNNVGDSAVLFSHKESGLKVIKFSLYLSKEDSWSTPITLSHNTRGHAYSPKLKKKSDNIIVAFWHEPFNESKHHTPIIKKLWHTCKHKTLNFLGQMSTSINGNKKL